MGLASGEIKASRNGRDPDEVAILTVLAFLFVFFFYLILKYRNKNNSGGSGSIGGNRKVYVGPIFGGGFQDSGSSWGGGYIDDITARTPCRAMAASSFRNTITAGQIPSHRSRMVMMDRVMRMLVSGMAIRFVSRKYSGKVPK